MEKNVRLKLNLLQPPRNDPELATKEFFETIVKTIGTDSSRLKSTTYFPDSFKKARIEIHLTRDRYHRARGDGMRVGPLIWLADAVCQKLSEIVNLNPGDWNNYRRGQQFRRLDNLLTDFGAELWRQREKRGS
jgi:hypothetical protein